MLRNPHSCGAIHFRDSKTAPGTFSFIVAKLPATWPPTFQRINHYPHWFCDADSELTAKSRPVRGGSHKLPANPAAIARHPGRTLTCTDSPITQRKSHCIHTHPRPGLRVVM